MSEINDFQDFKDLKIWQNFNFYFLFPVPFHS